MKPIKPPYNSNVLMAEYVYRLCSLCHSQPCYYSRSSTVQPSTVQPSSVQPSKQSYRCVQNLFNFIYSRYNKAMLCHACQHGVDWLPSTTNIVLSENKSNNNVQKLNIKYATYYQHPIDKVILRFKSGDMSALPILVHVIRQIPKPEGCSFNNSVIIPVPTTQNRLVARGFEPLSILSAYLSHHWQIPIANSIKRVDDVSSQKGLNRQQRMANLQDAFEFNHKSTKNLEYRTLILFDDVMTTGSTFKAMAEVIGKVVSPPNSLPLKAYCLAHVYRL